MTAPPQLWFLTSDYTSYVSIRLLTFNYELTSPKNCADIWTAPLEKKTLEYLFAWKDIQTSKVEINFALS